MKTIEHEETIRRLHECRHSESALKAQVKQLIAQASADYNALADSINWARKFGEVLPEPSRAVAAVVSALAAEKAKYAEALSVIQELRQKLATKPEETS